MSIDSFLFGGDRNRLRVYEGPTRSIFLIFYLSMIVKVLTPCGVNDFVCGRASKWVHNGTELCQSAGFAVNDDYHLDEMCYGGKASLDLIADSWKASRLVVPQRGGAGGVLDDFQQWAAEMPINERVSWAVGGMVLTAGLLFLRSDSFLSTTIRPQLVNHLFFFFSN